MDDVFMALVAEAVPIGVAASLGFGVLMCLICAGIRVFKDLIA